MLLSSDFTHNGYNKACSLCNNTQDNKLYSVKEMMQGTRDVFEYLACAGCGCLQVQQEPVNIADYYTEGYYSTSHNVAYLFQPFWKAWLKKYRDAYWITGKGWLGKQLQKRMPNQAIELANFRHLSLTRATRILDVGCGTGTLPYILYNAGFTNTFGIEPYIQKDMVYANGLRIKKGFLADYTDNLFDLVMFNHSFEHLSTPHEHLEAAYRLLKPGGRLLIRIPTVSSYAFQHYRENWVQWDAPRHTVLYSRKGIESMGATHQFELERIIDEGTAFQFIGSEQYKLDIPLHGDKRSWFEGNSSLFSAAQIAQFEQQAVELNSSGQSDSIAVTFRKK